MAFLLERDALNGKAGKGFMTIEGRYVELFGLKKLQVDADFQEADFKVVGTQLVQKKTTGIQLTGSMTIYYGTPEFLNLILEYRRTGKLPYFTLNVINEDASTSVGRQSIALSNVKLQKVPIAILDADSDFLTADVSFSFTDVKLLHAFNAPEQLGDN
jgi:hypothetical protein